MSGRSFLRNVMHSCLPLLLLFSLTVYLIDSGSTISNRLPQNDRKIISVADDHGVQQSTAEIQPPVQLSVSAAKPGRSRLSDLRDLFFTENDPAAAVHCAALPIVYPEDQPENIFYHELSNASITERAGPTPVVFYS